MLPYCFPWLCRPLWGLGRTVAGCGIGSSVGPYHAEREDAEENGTAPQPSLSMLLFVHRRLAFAFLLNDWELLTNIAVHLQSTVNPAPF